MPRLTPQDVAFYRENGYLTVEGALDRDTVTNLGRIVDDWTAAAADLTSSDAFYDLEDSHRPDAPRVRRLKTPVKHHPAFHDVARDPRLLDIVESLVGPNIRLSPPTDKINIKAPAYGAAVEWHQDWAFYPHTNDDLLAIGIALDDCAEENGPLLVIPGSHKGPIYDHHSQGVFCGAIDPTETDLDFSSAVPLIGPVGTVTVHHVRAVHGSALNTSDKPRRLYLIEYAAADAWPIKGVADLDAFERNVVRGNPALAVRMTDVPVRLPYPTPPKDGSIYERQEMLANRYFDTYRDNGATDAAE